MDNEPKILKKAYRIDLERIKDGEIYLEKFCHAKSLSNAKTELLKLAYDEDMSLRSNPWDSEKTELTYLNIPVVRHYIEDVVEYKGREITRREYFRAIEDERKNEGLQEILDNPSITHCYIKKGPYYRPNYCGYTDHLYRAGIYPKQDAISHVTGVREASAIPINNEEHNRMIEEQIKDLQSRII
jgi:hypothetical protein